MKTYPLSLISSVSRATLSARVSSSSLKWWKKRKNANDQHQKKGTKCITLHFATSFSLQVSVFSVTFGPGNPGKPSSPCGGKYMHTVSVISIVIVPLSERLYYHSMFCMCVWCFKQRLTVVYFSIIIFLFKILTLSKISFNRNSMQHQSLISFITLYTVFILQEVKIHLPFFP